jgi:transposase
LLEAVGAVLPLPDPLQPLGVDAGLAAIEARSQRRSEKKRSVRVGLYDLVGADALLPEMAADRLIADKAYDADARVLEPLAGAGKTAVIPPRSNRLAPRDFDRELYKERHLIENFFCKLKQFRAIATRYDKTAQNFLAAIHLAAAIIWLN